MTTSIVGKKMLYCQKCHQEYEPDGQRFCVNDGSRLVPVGSVQKTAQPPRTVFSTILSDVIKFDGTDDIFELSVEPFDNPIGKPDSPPSFDDSKFASLETEDRYKTQTEPVKSQPFSKVINPSEIPSGQAALGDREKYPTGRLALTWDKPEILLGQTVKGRYYVVKKLKQNDSSITYLAEDKLVAGKKVFVCVLMDEFGDDDLNEERVSLSHINHPNINRVIDSGSLLEGKSFIISEYIEGAPLKEVLAQNQEFEISRTARIIRQTANALSEAYQNGVLHRDLSPEDIILSLNETGTEQVKVTNFSISDGDVKSKNYSYKSPEHLTGNFVGSASDAYSLAIIAYQMLTGRLPFNAAAAGEHLRLRREGMTLRPSNFRLDVPFEADEILKKALSFNPPERYPKARDFGDALFNALTAAASANRKTVAENTGSQISAVTNKLSFEESDDLLSFPNLPESRPDTKNEFELLEVNNDVGIAAPISTAGLFPDADAVERNEFQTQPVRENKTEVETAANFTEPATSADPAWQRRSTEPMKPVRHSWTMFALFGIALLFAGLWGVWAYFLKQPNTPTVIPAQTVAQTEQTVKTANPPPVSSESSPLINEETELPPTLARKIEVPPNSIYFENSKEITSKELLKNYRGFSLYYPNNWKLNKADNKFIDVSMDASNGVPIEQIMISPYESTGLFSKDKELFPKLVEKSNKDLAAALDGKYEVVSEGETTIQSGRWKVYEVKFRAEGSVDGEKMTVWGRRLWMPIQRPGMGNGFIVTMLATSFSNDVKSVEDVGVKGKLAEILYTFEPDPNY